MAGINRNRWQLSPEYPNYTFIWTNWQFIANFIELKLDENILRDNGFAQDLSSLLIKKRLRNFEGINNERFHNDIDLVDIIFYNVNTSKFKGLFSGFLTIIDGLEEILPYEQIFHKSFFTSINNYNFTKRETIFFKGNEYE